MKILVITPLLTSLVMGCSNQDAEQQETQQGASETPWSAAVETKLRATEAVRLSLEQQKRQQQQLESIGMPPSP